MAELKDAQQQEMDGRLHSHSLPTLIQHSHLREFTAWRAICRGLNVSLAFQGNKPLTWLPSGSVVKKPPANARDASLTPGSGRSPRKGNDNPLQYSCLENSLDTGAWRATVHGVTKELDTTEHTQQDRLSVFQRGRIEKKAERWLPRMRL